MTPATVAPPAPAVRPNGTVSGILNRMERQARWFRIALFGAVALEAALMLMIFILIDWSDRGLAVSMMFNILDYTILTLGFVALGAHVSRVGVRIVQALDASSGA
jgi:hypothetical protein